MTLYELTNEYADLMRVLEQEAEPGSIEDLAIQDALSMVKLDIAEKADGYGKILRTLDAEIKAIRDEERRLAGRRRSLESNAERLKDRLRKSLEYMEVCSGEKPVVKGDLFTMSLRRSEAVVIDDTVDLEKVNPRYVTVTRTPNREEIKKSLKEGGFLSWAQLEERQNLAIR